MGQSSTLWQPNLVAHPESGTGIVQAGDAATIYVLTKKMSGDDDE